MRCRLTRVACLLTLAALAGTTTARAQECSIPRNLIISGGPGKDGIPSLTSPNVVPAAFGDEFLAPDALVLGVVVNGEARAYPHAVLWWHEIVNDVLGGKPVLVTFCPLTGSGIIYDPDFEGRAHNFGVSGLLFDNNLVMYDRTTDSLWSQMRPDGICGPFRGLRPALLPVVQTTWGRWKTLHPDTSVLSFRTGFARNYNRYPYGSYDQVDNEFLLFPHSSIDPRLPVKETVLGIAHEGTSRAYPMSAMSQAGPRLAINDDVNGLPVLVAFDTEGAMAVPFDRRIAGTSTEETETLEFDVVEPGPDVPAPFALRDRQTSSIWSLAGVAVSGPLAGEHLRPIATYSAFWFAWASFNPGTEIHTLQEPAPGSNP